MHDKHYPPLLRTLAKQNKHTCTNTKVNTTSITQYNNRFFIVADRAKFNLGSRPCSTNERFHCLNFERGTKKNLKECQYPS